MIIWLVTFPKKYWPRNMAFKTRDQAIRVCENLNINKKKYIKVTYLEDSYNRVPFNGEEVIDDSTYQGTKLKYLFLNNNNGHYSSYHPFITDVILTQENVTKRLLKIPGAGRVGTCVENLIEILLEEGHKADYWTCDCCGQVVRKLEKPNLKDWEVVEGICGNY